jgi:hypothetical protein
MYRAIALAVKNPNHLNMATFFFVKLNIFEEAILQCSIACYSVAFYEFQASIIFFHRYRNISLFHRIKLSKGKVSEMWRWQLPDVSQIQLSWIKT